MELRPIESRLDAPSRRSRVEMYLYDHGDEHSAELAGDFFIPGKPVAKTAVAIPVAAHQESSNIIPALEQYSKQQPAEPFTIFLYLNNPFEADSEAVEASVRQAGRAQQIFSGQLDIRIAQSAYLEQAPIGAVRKDLWDAIARLALHDGVYGQQGDEMLIVNHDIDTDYIHPAYIGNIQKFYANKQRKHSSIGVHSEAMKPQYTQTRHSLPQKTHPNMAKAIFWVDSIYRQAQDMVGYECGLVVPLSHYAKQGGFNRSDTTHETAQIRGSGNTSTIHGTSMQTSPRRYIDRFAEYGYEGIWTHDSFTANDRCRDEGSQRDISRHVLESRVLGSFNDHFDHVLLPAAEGAAHSRANRDGLMPGFVDSKVQFEEYLFYEYSKTLLIANRALRRSLGLDLVADLAASQYDPEDLVRRYMT